MTMLIECPGCARHVRADDGRCPFCARPSTTGAPVRMLALMLPLTLMACTGGETPAPATKPEVAAPKPTPANDAGAEPAQPSKPADGGAVVDVVPDGDGGDRPMATKYGGPPAMDGPAPTPTPAMDDGAVPPEDPPADMVEPPAVEPPESQARPARKYGAAPRPTKKYGAPPRPDDGPLG